MENIGLVSVIAGAMTAAVIGFAGPAQADGNGPGFNGRDGGSGFDWGYRYDRDHRNNPWRDKVFPSVKVPQVDTSVRN